MGDGELRVYTIAGGGPLRRAERALRITRDDRRGPRACAVVIALVYAPVLALGIGWRAVTGDWTPALEELTTHVRALVVLPLLLLVEQVIDERAGIAGSYLLRSRIVGPESLAGHRSAITRTARLRDSGLVEAAIVAASVASLFFLPAFTRETEPVLRWSLQPIALLCRLLAFRLLWRWCLWALFLGRLSRLPLALRATHPDRVAGLTPLAGPSIGFGLLVMAGAASSAASWGDRMRFEGVAATTFLNLGITYVLLAVVVAAAPLWAFTGRLIRLRRSGVPAYSALASRYSGAFERRWFERSGEEALGAADFQSLNDLGSSFERVERMRAVVAPRAMISAIVAAAALPMLPLILAEVDAITLLLHLGKAILR